jgi:hypothetical protein
MMKDRQAQARPDQQINDAQQYYCLLLSRARDRIRPHERLIKHFNFWCVTKNTGKSVQLRLCVLTVLWRLSGLNGAPTAVQAEVGQC